MIGCIPVDVLEKVRASQSESLIWKFLKDRTINELKILSGLAKQTPMRGHACPLCEHVYFGIDDKCMCIDSQDYSSYRIDNSHKIHPKFTSLMIGISKNGLSKSLTELEMIKGYEEIVAEMISVDLEEVEIVDFITDYLTCGLSLIVCNRPLNASEFAIAKKLDEYGIYFRNQKNNALTLMKAVS